MTSYSYTKAEWFVARRRGLEADETEKKNTDEGKNSRRPLNGRCGGPHSRSGRFLEEKNDACHCRESSHDSSVVPYAVITSTMLSQYHG